MDWPDQIVVRGQTWQRIPLDDPRWGDADTTLNAGYENGVACVTGGVLPKDLDLNTTAESRRDLLAAKLETFVMTAELYLDRH